MKRMEEERRVERASECVVTGRGSGEEGKGGSALNFFLLEFQYVLSLV